MSTIVYSVNGEGRGHATRVQAIIEMLVPKHRFVLLASEDAYDHFCGEYQDHPSVKVSPVPGLRFQYANGRLSYVKSVFGAMPFLWNLKKSVKSVERILLRESPDIAITDFEPLLPRAADNLGIPWLSLDHQHFLCVSDFRGLPTKLRWQSRFLRCSIGMFYRRQSGEAVSSFAHLPSRNGCESVQRIGVLIRKEIQAMRNQTANEGFLLVYVRGAAPKTFWQSLSQLDKAIHVFGKCVPPVLRNVEYFGIHNDTFIRQLSKCEALITTAGNQLVGEAFYLKKPVLAIPEQGNFEQGVNAWLVSQTQAGWSLPFNQVTPHLLSQFLLCVPMLSERISDLHCFGNEDARQFIEQHLTEASFETDSPESPFRSVA